MNTLQSVYVDGYSGQTSGDLVQVYTLPTRSSAPHQLAPPGCASTSSGGGIARPEEKAGTRAGSGESPQGYIRLVWPCTGSISP